MYIERCKHGSEGGLYKPTIEIWQGGTFLPYSYITMNPEGWKQNTYAASCSVADRVLFQCLKDNPNLNEVYLCFDSDNAGQTAAKRIADKLFTQGYKSEILVPAKKDWNEELISQKEGEQTWTEQSF